MEALGIDVMFAAGFIGGSVFSFGLLCLHMEFLAMSTKRSRCDK